MAEFPLSSRLIDAFAYVPEHCQRDWQKLIKNVMQTERDFAQAQQYAQLHADDPEIGVLFKSVLAERAELQAHVDGQLAALRRAVVH